ncbi:Glucose-6-phosphate isomerase [Frankia sp. AiPs1]|uniref:cupin domain-containing protein n=1 Tax=Frankia sp. AiPa1 TaxID=573492 RepID=UPI00202B86D6|nr:cupin domain-containing protein [Frankia sp. AiPa1]MCL9762989.1 hypothetical protein [Frankia sp. AiPa1]
MDLPAAPRPATTTATTENDLSATLASLLGAAPDPPSRRFLSHLLHGDAGASRPHTVFADRRQVETALEAGEDPLLYEAYRDVAPARHGWRADLVVYQPGTLPDGQPHRSIGHWNPPTQLEIFQILSGTTLMLVAGHRPDGSRYVHQVTTRAGDVTVVPFGAWHLTYVLDGPAAVFNIYTDIHLDPDDAHSRQDDAKYRRAAAPGLVIVRDGETVLPVTAMDSQRDDDLPPLPELPPWPGSWPRRIGLADLHRHASQDDWAALIRTARTTKILKGPL